MKSRLTDLTQPQREKVMELRGRGAPWAEIARYVTTKVGKVEQEAVRRFFKDGLPPVEQPGEIQRLEDEVRRARSAEREAIDRAVEAERLREIFNAAKSITPTIPEWTIERSKAKDVPHVPVLFMSDAHFGEVIAADNMDGLNEYNLSIAEERYRRLISKTIELSFEHLPKNRYEGIIVLRGGDTVSGDIHDELSKTNDLPTIPTCRWVAGLEAWGLDQLAEAFGEVYVISVPGNHGRTTRKPESKLTSQQSYDNLVSWWIEDRLHFDTRVTFYTPASGDAVFDIHDRAYLLTHGDRIGSKGGQGFIGPAAPILRGMKRIMDTQAAIHQPVDRIFLGHFHTSLDLGYGWANGSIPGYSEYGRDGRFRPEPATQWLINFHPKYGATSTWPIYLTAQPVGTRTRRPFTK